MLSLSSIKRLLKAPRIKAPRITRRHFLIGSAATLALAGGYGLSRYPLKIGLIGAGFRGKALAASLSQTYWLPLHYPEVVAICDVDRKHAQEVRSLHWPHAELYGSYRQVLERDDIRAVVIATPDHWHALIARDAMKAGKAVYCEKPISLTIAEGQMLVRTVRETGCVFQAGTQQRSDWRFRTAAELVRNNRLGQLNRVTLTLPQRWRGVSPGPFPTSSPPPELDWDQWLGQAPLVGYCPERAHGMFRRWFEYSGGQMTDWGAHHMDIACWAMGLEDVGTTTVEANAVFPNVPGGFNTPIEFTADLHLPSGVQIHIQTDSNEDLNGITFEGEAGSFFVSREQLEGPAVRELQDRPLPSDAIRLHESSPHKSMVLTRHLLQFFDCIDNGSQPLSDVVSHHRALTFCHLANIAMRTGRKLTWDNQREQIVGDPEVNAMLSRAQRRPYDIPEV